MTSYRKTTPRWPLGCTASSTLEGDLDNARYWYGKAGRGYRGREAVEDEIGAARREAVGLDASR